MLNAALGLRPEVDFHVFFEDADLKPEGVRKRSNTCQGENEAVEIVY